MADYLDEYSDSPSAPSAARARPGKDETPITEDGSPKTSGETISIPTEFLQGAKFKAGDEIVMKVVGVSEDGLEVAYAKGEEPEPDANSELDGMERSYQEGG